MLIVLVMFLLGLVLGFVGAGGAGFVIALLTMMFHIPIHTALGTSLAGMAFRAYQERTATFAKEISS